MYRHLEVGLCLGFVWFTIEEVNGWDLAGYMYQRVLDLCYPILPGSLQSHSVGNIKALALEYINIKSVIRGLYAPKTIIGLQYSNRNHIQDALYTQTTQLRTLTLGATAHNDRLCTFPVWTTSNNEPFPPVPNLRLPSTAHLDDSTPLSPLPACQPYPTIRQSPAASTSPGAMMVSTKAHESQLPQASAS